MNSKEYISKALEELHNEFPSFTFKYQYDSLDDSYVIEYSPFDLINGDIDFENRKFAILEDYFNNNYSESLVFINEFDPVGISKPEVVYEGHFSYTAKYDIPQVILSSLLIWDEVFFSESYDYSLAA